MATSTFNHVKGLKPRRSRFNIGYGKAYDCDMGQLIPSMVKFMVPGDIFTMHQEAVIRTKAPLRSPAFAELNCYSYTFFVPLRILFGESVQNNEGWLDWEIKDHDFEKFITGGRTGNDDSVVLPRWVPTGTSVVNDNWNGIASGVSGSNVDDANVTVLDNGLYSLWDYLEMPVGVVPVGAYPLDFWKRAYNLIYNEWFRDENVMPPVAVESNDRVLQATWKKDYFTSMLPWQQRGTAPQLPVSGVIPVDFAQSIYAFNGSDFGGFKLDPDSSGDLKGTVYTQNGTSAAATGTLKGSVDLSNATTFSVADLRVAFQIQRWMELNAKCGSRLVEYLRANYGTAPSDDTLQRPMFIGGCKSPVIITEVLQTSAEGNDGVGSMKGHSISADRNYMGRFRANEFGVIMTLSVIRPKAMYHQGIDRENLYDNRYQFFNPAFVWLSEQGVMAAELYAQNSGNVDANGDPVNLGFQGMYNELRSSHNKVCGALRGGQSLSYWAMTRTFQNLPVLNGQFLKCIPNKDIFAVTDEPAFVCYFNNRITAYRPLPVDAQGGYIDHIYGERR